MPLRISKAKSQRTTSLTKFSRGPLRCEGIIRIPDSGITNSSFSQEEVLEVECELLISNFKTAKTIDLVDENIRHISNGSSPHSTNALKLGLKKAFNRKNLRVNLGRSNNERITELNAAKVSITNPDAVSKVEVVRLVDNLNILIRFTSGALSCTWDQQDPMPETFVEDSDLEPIRNNFGDLVAKQVAARNVVAVHLAIQMHLGWFVKRITSGWGSGQVAGTLAEIYRTISTKGKLYAYF